MRTITLEIKDNAFEKIMQLLKNLSSNDFRIIEKNAAIAATQELQAFSNSSANQVSDWLDKSEDDVWK